MPVHATLVAEPATLTLAQTNHMAGSALNLGAPFSNQAFLEPSFKITRRVGGGGASGRISYRGVPLYLYMSHICRPSARGSPDGPVHTRDQ